MDSFLSTARHFTITMMIIFITACAFIATNAHATYVDACAQPKKHHHKHKKHHHRRQHCAVEKYIVFYCNDPCTPQATYRCVREFSYHRGRNASSVEMCVLESYRE